MDVSMGDSRATEASAMVAYFGILQNLIVEVPRHQETGDTTICLTLSLACSRKFRDFCHGKKCKVPFDIVI
eukprot:scaffold15735_cov152-Amphora_coffeaeformis.AAC.13